MRSRIRIPKNEKSNLDPQPQHWFLSTKNISMKTAAAKLDFMLSRTLQEPPEPENETFQIFAFPDP
jgi:hypothetical protein